MKHVEDSRLYPCRRVLFKAHACGDLVRREKTDSENVGRQPVRILRNDFDGVPTVLLEDLGGIGRTHPMPLEEDHDAADLLLLLPGLVDHLDPLVPDAVHLVEVSDMLVNDLQGLFTE